jgi:hypothetical protein
MCLELAYGAASRCVHRNSDLDSAYWTKVQYTGPPVLIEDAWTKIGGSRCRALDQAVGANDLWVTGTKNREEDEGCKLKTVLSPRLGCGAATWLALAVPISGRARNRTRMSCATRLKRVFDLDIERCPNCRRAFSGGTLPTSHGANFMGRYPGQA